MRPDLHRIARERPGHLSTMARPRGGDWLVADLRGLRTSGVDVLVSLLTEDEETHLGLSDEATVASETGLEFLRLRTRDRTCPPREATVRLARDLGARLAQGRHVAVHCRAGIGRASVLAAAVLVCEDVAPAEAWRRITAARGLPVPDTPEQRAFVKTLVGPDDRADG